MIDRKKSAPKLRVKNIEAIQILKARINYLICCKIQRVNSGTKTDYKKSEASG